MLILVCVSLKTPFSYAAYISRCQCLDTEPVYSRAILVHLYSRPVSELPDTQYRSTVQPDKQKLISDWLFRVRKVC